MFQRTENENHGHCYLPYLSGSSSLLFLLLTAPCIINHTWSTESSSECSSLFHSAQIFCYSKQKSVKDLHVGQKTKNIEIHMDHHSFVRSLTTRRTKFKRKSPDKQEQCLGDGGGDHRLREWWNSSDVRSFLMVSTCFYKQPTDSLTVTEDMSKDGKISA